ncbi:MAG TPA: hypothetical protein PLD57_02185 [Aggregatilineales bacterium]|nr:hypothetical protein [Aggregatilineales bacterium]
MAIVVFTLAAVLLLVAYLVGWRPRPAQSINRTGDDSARDVLRQSEDN